MSFPRVVLGALAFVVLMLAAAVRSAPVGAAPGQEPPVVQEIEVSAKKYEFSPKQIDVALNTVVRLKITAQDRDHGFEIEGVKGSKVDLKKGQVTVVEYKADKAGTFAFKCTTFCGFGHGRMKGAIVVK